MESHAEHPADLSDLRSFERLYRRYYGYVWAVLARLGVRAIDDAHQEVFLTAYRRRETFEPGKPIRPWLVGISRRVAFRSRRGEQRRARKQSALALDSRAYALPKVLEGQVEARDFLGRFVVGLDPRVRDIFVLGELHGLTGTEISQKLGIQRDTVYARLRAARTQLRRELLATEAGREPDAARVSHGFSLLLPCLRPLSSSSVGAATAASTSWLPMFSAVVLAGFVVVAGAGAGPSSPDPDRPVAGSPPRTTAATTPASRSSTVVPQTPQELPAVVTPAPLASGSARRSAPAPAPAPASTPRGGAGVDVRSPVSDSADGPVEPGAEPPADLSRQARELGEARMKLNAGHAAQALAELAEHAERFPDSPLAHARGALRVEVLCALGRAADAHHEAAQLQRRYPNSNIARHAAETCPEPERAR